MENKKVGGRELEMTQTRVRKQVRRRESSEAPTELGTSRRPSHQAIKASTLRVIQSIELAIAKG